MPASVEHLSDARLLADNVLAHWTDSLFYRVTIVKCFKKARKCLVRFEDDHLHWMDAKDLHIQLPLDIVKDDQIVCSICDGGSSSSPNEIIICDICQQGVHIECHQPTICRETVDPDNENAEWICATCRTLLGLPPTQQPVRPVEQLSTDTFVDTLLETTSTIATAKSFPEKLCES